MVVKDASGDAGYSTLLYTSNTYPYDASDNALNISGDAIILSGNLIPSQTNTYSVGTPNNPFKHGYFGPDSVTIGNTVYSSDIQGNSTVTSRNGNPTALPGSQTSENLMVAAGGSTQGTQIKYSINGTSWNNVDAVEGYDMAAAATIAWASPNWLAVGAYSYNSAGVRINCPILTSTTALKWLPSTLINTDADVKQFFSLIGSQNYGGRSACFNTGDNRWYMGIYYENGGLQYKQYYILRSKDSTGNDWESAVDPSSDMFEYMVVNNITSDGGIQNGILVATGYSDASTSCILYSTAESGFKTWKNATDICGNRFGGVGGQCAFSGTSWIVATNTGAYRSTDGKTWGLVFSLDDPNHAGFAGSDIAFNGQSWIMVGISGGNRIYISYDDGITWSYVSGTSGCTLAAISWNGSQWITGGYGLNTFGLNLLPGETLSFLTSTNGVDWYGVQGAQFDGQVSSIASRRNLPYTNATANTPILHGSGPPSAAAGEDHALYNDTTTGAQYVKHKSTSIGYGGSASVSLGGSINVGVAGASGSIYFDGAAYITIDPRLTSYPNEFNFPGPFLIQWTQNLSPLTSTPFAIDDPISGTFGVAIDDAGNITVSLNNTTLVYNAVDNPTNPVLIDVWQTFALERDLANNITLTLDSVPLVPSGAAIVSGPLGSAASLYIGYTMQGFISQFIVSNVLGYKNVIDITQPGYTYLNISTALATPPISDVQKTTDAVWANTVVSNGPVEFSTNAPIPSAFAGSVQFDGSANTYLSIDPTTAPYFEEFSLTTAAILPPNPIFTIQWWQYLTAVDQSTSVVFSVSDPVIGLFGVFIDASLNITAYVNNGHAPLLFTAADNPDAVSLLAWQRFTLARDSLSRITLSLNGVPLLLAADLNNYVPGTLGTTTAPLIIGRRTTGYITGFTWTLGYYTIPGNVLFGQTVEFLNIAPAAAPIQDALHPNGPYWRNSIVPTGNAVWDGYSPPSVPTTGSPTFDLTGAFTFKWFQNIQGSAIIFESVDTSGSVFNIIVGTDITLNLNAATPVSYSYLAIDNSNNPVVFGVWQWFVLTRDVAGNISLYLNGQALVPSTPIPPITDELGGKQSMTIGIGFAGFISNFVLYNGTAISDVSVPTGTTDISGASFSLLMNTSCTYNDVSTNNVAYVSSYSLVKWVAINPFSTTVNYWELTNAGILIPLQMVAVGSTSILTSTDGLTWSVVEPTFDGRGVAWNGSRWTVVGPDSILTSTNGLTWSFVGPTFDGRAVACSGSRWIAVGSTSILTSTDGLTWSVVGPTFDGRAVAWNGIRWIAVGSTSILTSTDGLSWSVVGPTFDGRAVAWNGSLWVAVGPDSILTSADGLSWTAVSGIYSGNGVAWNGTMWVVVGSTSILMSTDGLTWSVVGPTYSGRAIAWNGNRWMAVGADSFLTSTDGLTWLTVGPTFDGYGIMTTNVWQSTPPDSQTAMARLLLKIYQQFGAI
jgi:hypothetical protein